MIRRALPWAVVVLFSVTLIASAQSTPPPVQPAPGKVATAPGIEEEQPKNLWGLIVAGGWVMYPLFACALVWLTVTLERIISLVVETRRLKHPLLVSSLREMAREGRFDRDAVVGRCKELGSTAGAIFAVGARHIGQHITVVEKAIEDEGRHHVYRIRRFLRVLMITANLAPLLGLLGTVVGMIDAFRRVAEQEGALGMASKLATGIYQALVTTAAGLVIAVLSLFCYYVLRSWADVLARNLSSEVDEFLDIVAGGSDPRTAAPGATPPPVAREVPRASS